MDFFKKNILRPRGFGECGRCGNALALLRRLLCGRLLCDFALWSDFALRDLLGLLFCCHMKEKELRPA